MNQTTTHKVPEVTFLFWLIKIAATTLGETAGDAVTMSMNLGYLAGTAIFAALFVIGVRAQISARRLYIFLYWAVIVATTTVGTTLADLLDRSVGIGYVGGSSILLALVIGTLLIWRRTLGTILVQFPWPIGTVTTAFSIVRAYGSDIANTPKSFSNASFIKLCCTICCFRTFS